MKNILFILLVFIGFISNAQDFQKPEQHPTEFSKYSYEAMEWYNKNLDVMNYNFTSIDNHVFSVIKNNPNIQNFDLLVSLLSAPCKNDLEKVRAFYIWNINSMKYDLKVRNEMTRSIYESSTLEDDMIYCFNKRRGVCYENSAIFYYMCKKSNVTAFVITGYMVKNDTESHAWNMFKYNGKFYFMDVTWGNQLTAKSDNYKNFHFIINEELYKYIYKAPMFVYTELSFDNGERVTPRFNKSEKNWTVGYKEYADFNVVKNNNHSGMVYIDNYKTKTGNINYADVNRFSYSSFTVETMKVWESKYKAPVKIETAKPEDFIMLDKKAYNKLSSSEKAEYEKKGRIYFEYWDAHYKEKNITPPTFFMYDSIDFYLHRYKK